MASPLDDNPATRPIEKLKEPTVLDDLTENIGGKIAECTRAAARIEEATFRLGAPVEGVDKVAPPVPEQSPPNTHVERLGDINGRLADLRNDLERVLGRLDRQI